jgi:methionyl-tRNA formyltransferase
MRLIFFGTPQFAATILDSLLQQSVEIVAVVTRPDKPKGRSAQALPSPVKVLALAHRIPVYQPDKASEPDFVSFLATLNPDLFIVAAYAEILKEALLATPKWGCINVHASLLPKYRGAAPIQRAIMAGEKESGVTIMKMARQLDAGEMLERVKLPIPESMTAGELEEKLAHAGAEALWRVIQALEKGTLEPAAQDPSQVTYAKKLTAEEGEISWDRPSDEVFNHIRGVTPKPGAWCWVKVRGEKKRLLIKRAEKIALETPENPGKIISKSPQELLIACREGAIRLLEVQLEGKKSLITNLFLTGIPLVNLEF